MKEELSTVLTNISRTKEDRMVFMWTEYENMYQPGQYHGSFRNVSQRELNQHRHEFIGNEERVRFLDLVYNPRTHKTQPRVS